MNARAYLEGMAVTTPIAFVVAAVVTYLYSLVVHGAASVDWETAFELALTLGVVLPLVLENGARDTRR